MTIAHPAHPRLPRPEADVVRRPRQLLAGRPRADHLPRDRLRRGRPVRGLDITITTSADRRRGGLRPPRAFGMPFAARAALRPSWPKNGDSCLMAKTSQRVRQARPAKYKTREYTRCRRCGRPAPVYRKFGLCRICLRELAHKGYDPGHDQVGRGSPGMSITDPIADFLTPRPQRHPGGARDGRDPVQQAQARAGAHPQGAGLHPRLRDRAAERRAPGPAPARRQLKYTTTAARPSRASSASRGPVSAPTRPPARSPRSRAAWARRSCPRRGA